MNYTKIYNLIISNRLQNTISKVDVYCEEHHIIPRAFNGNDSKNNKVMLTAREHYICHHLLTKMYNFTSKEWHKMIRAFMRMHTSCGKQQRYFNARTYAKLKTDHAYSMSVSQTGKGNSQYGTMWISNISMRECKRISKTACIAEGWQKGRIINFDKFLAKKKAKKKNALKQIQQQLHQKETKLAKDQILKHKAQQKIESRIIVKEETIKLYNEYLVGDYKSLRDLHRKLKLPYSIMTISNRFKKYISGYAKNSIPTVSIKG